MAEFSPRERTLHLKVVYCGPAKAGKATNVMQVHRALGPEHAPKSEPERSGGALCLSLAPLTLQVPGPLKIVISVCAVSSRAQEPGVLAAALREADALVFVADAQRGRLRDNLLGWADLLEHVRRMGRRIDDFPLVFQVNKVEHPGAMEAADVDAALNFGGSVCFTAEAIGGRGVGKCFSEVVRRAVGRLWLQLQLGEHGISRGALSTGLDAALVREGTRAAARLRDGAGSGEAEAAGLPDASPVEAVGAGRRRSESEAACERAAETSAELVDAVGSRELPAWIELSLEQAYERARREERDAASASTLDRCHRGGRKSIAYLRRVFQCLEEEAAELPRTLREVLGGSGSVLDFLERSCADIDSVAAALKTSAARCDFERVLNEVAAELSWRDGLTLHGSLPRLPALKGDACELRLALVCAVRGLASVDGCVRVFGRGSERAVYLHLVAGDGSRVRPSRDEPTAAAVALLEFCGGRLRDGGDRFVIRIPTDRLESSPVTAPRRVACSIPRSVPAQVEGSGRGR